MTIAPSLEAVLSWALDSPIISTPKLFLFAGQGKEKKPGSGG